MDFSSRMVHLKIAVNEDVTISPFIHDDVTMLFSDVDRPVELFINHKDPTECQIIFQSDDYITEVLKLAGTTEWIGTIMDIDLRRPRAELVLIAKKLVEHKALEEGKEYKYITIENVEHIHHSTPKKEDASSAAAMLVGNIKKLPLEDLKPVLSTVDHEMEEKRIPLGSPSKPSDQSSIHPHDVPSVLHSLIKEGTLRTNVPKLSSFSGKTAKGEVSFEQWCYG